MSWSNKTKVITAIERGRILTHAGDQVLVGADEDQILIWQAASDTWEFKPRLTGVWENKVKIAA